MSKAPQGRSSIHRRRNADGWEGWISFGRHPVTGRRIRKHVSGVTQSEVADKIKRLEAERDHGYQALDGDVTLLNWLDAWIVSKQGTVRPKTLVGYRVDRSHLASNKVGKIKLSKLTPEHIEQLYADVLARPRCSGGTVAHLRRTLSAALNTAVSRGRLARSPIKLAHVPSHDAEEIEPLTVSEAKRILVAARDRRNSARWSVGLALGLRQGEVLGLQWPDIDLDDGTLRIRRQLQRLTWQHGCDDPSLCRHPRTGKPNRGTDCPRRHGGGLVVSQPKSKAGRRRVALPAELVAELREQRNIQAAERAAAGPLWRGGKWVFATEIGGPIDPRKDYQNWVELLRCADVRMARLHDARHTAATLLLVLGVDSRTVMALMGWSSMTLTQRYQHVIDDLRRDAAERMGRTLWAD